MQAFREVLQQNTRYIQQFSNWSLLSFEYIITKLNKQSKYLVIED